MRIRRYLQEETKTQEISIKLLREIQLTIKMPRATLIPEM